MTWVAPHSWVTDEQITSSLLNETRDNLLAISHPHDYSNSDVDVVSTAVETSLYSVLVPGGSLGSSGSIELWLLADHMFNNSASDTVTVRVKWGGSTVFTGVGNTNSTSPNRDGAGVHLWIGNRSSVSSQLMVCHMALGTPTGGATGTPLRGTLGVGGLPATAAIDTSTDQTLQVTAQWSASAAGNSFRKRLAISRIAQN